MKRLFFTLGFCLMVSALLAQGIVGDWSGVLDANGAKLRIIFHITKIGDTYKSTMDSPDQRAVGLPVGATTLVGNNVSINASQYGINYKGTYLPDSNKINGSFQGGGKEIQFNLIWSKSIAIVRPQEPKDFPYKREEVAFENIKAGVRLAGTLTVPADGKITKIVILINGSGPHDRNEELMNHRPFLVWSDWLTRHGIAVLRYDDRGVGKSTGDFNMATTADLANDVEAAMTYIQSRPDLKDLSIGLIGHSEGGLIAPMVASRNKSVKFIVMLAGPGVPDVDLMAKQTEDVARVAGAPEKTAQLAGQRNKVLYNVVVQNSTLSVAELKPLLDTAVYKAFRSEAPGISNAILAQTAQQYYVLLSPWSRYFFAANPADYLTKIKIPVLALDGTKDLQVNGEQNLAGIKASLEKAGNKHFEVVLLPDLNHLFQKATTGSVDEYSQITETVDPIALEKVSGWINKL
jgi:pimeloyl-ACP methyl ester carboxylesterase